MHNGAVEDHYAGILEQLHVHCHDGNALLEELPLATASYGEGGG